MLGVLDLNIMQHIRIILVILAVVMSASVWEVEHRDSYGSATMSISLRVYSIVVALAFIMIAYHTPIDTVVTLRDIGEWVRKIILAGWSFFVIYTLSIIVLRYNRHIGAARVAMAVLIIPVLIVCGILDCLAAGARTITGDLRQAGIK